MKCLKDIPVQDIKGHVEDCYGQSSKHRKCGSSLSKPSSSIDLENLSEEILGEQEEKKVKETLEFVSAMQDEKPWEEELELMFPGSSIESIKRQFLRLHPQMKQQKYYVKTPAQKKNMFKILLLTTPLKV